MILLSFFFKTTMFQTVASLHCVVQKICKYRLKKKINYFISYFKLIECCSIDVSGRVNMAAPLDIRLLFFESQDTEQKLFQ